MAQLWQKMSMYSVEKIRENMNAVFAASVSNNRVVESIKIESITLGNVSPRISNLKVIERTDDQCADDTLGVEVVPNLDCLIMALFIADC